MSLLGWYYLHENGDLIYKVEMGDTAADLRESAFVKMIWPLDTDDRAGAWRILVEALACGANKSRVKELAAKWGCDNTDAEEYASHIGVILKMDGNAKCATRNDFVNLQESPVGFGETALEAFADLCNNLGFKPKKMWGHTFVDLVSKK